MQINHKKLNQEQENLLVLLQEMETKLKEYKHSLRSMGYEDLSESEDELDDSHVDSTDLAKFNSPKETNPSNKSFASNFDDDNKLESNEFTGDQYEANQGIILNNPNFSSSNESSHANVSLNSTTSGSENSADFKPSPINQPPPTGQNLISIVANGYENKPNQGSFNINPVSFFTNQSQSISQPHQSNTQQKYF